MINQTFWAIKQIAFKLVSSILRPFNFQFAILIILIIPIYGCEPAAGAAYDQHQPVHHTKITSQTAQEMMELPDTDIIILDVRTADEFQTGHIPGAVLMPVNQIREMAGYLIPDWDQIILVYCRSGARSNDAALILVELGYRAVYDFGGILDWHGEIER